MNILWQIEAWFQTWPERKPWKDAPAILAGVTFLGVGFVLLNWESASTRVHYSAVIKKALVAKDYQTARVACQRVLAMGNQSLSPTLLDLSIAMQGLGQEQEAAKILAMVAPPDRPGYAPAHLYAAKILLSGSNTSPDVSSAVEMHLRHALEIQPDSPEANEILARLYFQRGDWLTAKKHLLIAVSTNPEDMFLLSAAAAQLNDESGKQDWLDRAERFFRNKTEKSKIDPVQDRLLWVQALVLQERNDEANKVLEQGLRMSNKDIYRVAIATNCSLWAQRVTVKDPDNLELRIELIRKGLEAAPQNARLLQLLMEVSHLPAPEGDLARKTFTRMLGEGKNSAILHFIMGNEAWQQGDVEAARQHFSLAYELAPNMPAVANNMAMLLTLGEKPDFTRALQIVDSALKRLPDEPSLRDTRGQILVKLGRWNEAIRELEFALPEIRSKRATHSALATAYAGIGMKDVAEEHNRLAADAARRENGSRQSLFESKSAANPAAEPLTAPHSDSGAN